MEKGLGGSVVNTLLLISSISIITLLLIYVAARVGSLTFYLLRQLG